MICLFQVRNSKHERNQKDPDIAMALALSRSIAEENLESRVSREEKLLALGLEDIVEEDRKVSPMLLLPPDSGNTTFFTHNEVMRVMKDETDNKLL